MFNLANSNMIGKANVMRLGSGFEVLRDGFEQVIGTSLAWSSKGLERAS